MTDLPNHQAVQTQTAENFPPRILLLLVSFLGGFQIMVLEVCGFRVLQTNLGSSVVVTGTLLTLVMVLLSFGYYCGGRLRGGGVRPLTGLLLLAALYTQVVDVHYAESVAGLTLDLRDRLYGHPFLDSGLPAALLSLILYGPPVFVMSMISPFLIRLCTRSGGDEAGRQSGFFMSLSTVGSIAGTLLCSYWLIPFFGVGETVVYTNFAMAAVLALTFISAGPPSPAALMALGVPFALYLWNPLPAENLGRQSEEVIFQRDSYYGNIRIVATKDAAGRRLLEYQPSRVYTHSVLYPDQPLRELPGLQYLVTPLSRPPGKILILGSAAGGIIRQIEAVFPEAGVTGVDIDPKIHQVARDIFGVDANRARLVARDARMFLEETAETYDLIVVDLFAGEFIPPHCISLEFFRLLKTRLAEDGAVFINTNMNDVPGDVPGDQEPFRPVRHLHATLMAAGFPALFENRYFHSLYVYPRPMSEERVIGALLGRFRDTLQHRAVRAAAGVAAFTTAEVPSGHGRYRPYTDRWMPAPLVELKSNEAAIYQALGTAYGEAGPVAMPPGLERLTVEQVLAEGSEHGYVTALRDPGRLVERLEREAAATPRIDRRSAARFLRFSPELPEQPLDSEAPALSPDARTAARYARLYRLAYGNDYENLLETLAVLDRQFSDDPLPSRNAAHEGGNPSRNL